MDCSSTVWASSESEHPHNPFSYVCRAHPSVSPVRPASSSETPSSCIPRPPPPSPRRTRATWLPPLPPQLGGRTPAPPPPPSLPLSCGASPAQPLTTGAARPKSAQPRQKNPPRAPPLLVLPGDHSARAHLAAAPLPHASTTFHTRCHPARFIRLHRPIQQATFQNRWPCLSLRYSLRQILRQTPIVRR